MIIVDRDGSIVRVNAQAEKLFGYDKGELVGSQIEKLVPTRFRREHPQFRNSFFLDASARPMGAGRDLFGVRKDGTEISVEIGLNPFSSDAGEMVLASVVDITERKRAEQHLRLLIEASPSGMLMVDSQGTIVLVNAQIESLFGYARQELIGRKIEDLVPVRFRLDHPRLREEFFEHPQVRAMGAVRDLYGVRSDGTELPVEIGLNPIDTDEGRFVLASVVDITARRRTEQELLQAKDDLEKRVIERTKELQSRTTDLVELNDQLAHASERALESSRLKSQFLANMSHEIRTPMNAIIGMCNVLLRTQLQPRQHEYATHIKEGANALLVVINDILDFSKIEAGKLELEPVDFNLVKVVEGTCELLAMTARSKQVSLMAYVDTNLPTKLHGDPERLRQILLNLTSNAVKFSDDGEIVVRADLDSIDHSAGTVIVKFSVIDQGIGMTGSERSKLFQPFVQADGSISRRFGGTGLGLSISKRLVELMGGEISVDSIQGEGSTFWFSIPFTFTPSESAQRVQTELKDIRILIVDDEPNARNILHEYIVSWGMRNGIAGSGKDALRMLRQGYVDGDPYKIAIVDLVMPEMNGMDLAEQIAKDPAIKDCRLILLTGWDAPGLGVQAMHLGFKAYLTKPVRQSQMYDCIVSVLSDSPSMGRSSADARLSTRGSGAARKEVILIAEDYAINQQVAQLYLDEMGFASHIVSNGAEAVEAASRHDYALILMDCQMPEMDGYTATQKIREMEKATGKHVPIIAMTAHAMGGDRERCLEAGMDEYISKPVEPEALRVMLDKWLPDMSATDASAHRLLPIDLQIARAKYGQRADELCRMFVSKSELELVQLIKHLEHGHTRDALNVVHGLKGVCSTISAQPMRLTCLEIELALHNGDVQLASDLAAQLGVEFSEVQRYLEQEIGASPPGGESEDPASDA
jgi:polar amino acid transport system substrate-binding protein